MLDFEDPPKEYEFNIWTGDKVRVQYYGEGDLIPESGGFKAGDVRGEFLIGATAQFDIVNTKGESLAGNDIYYLDDDYQYIGLINEDIGIGLSSKEDFREDIEEMCRCNEAFKKALLSDDLTVMAEADVTFHDVIYRTTGNKRLIQILNNLREQMYRYRLEYIKDENKRKILVAEHDSLVKAISERNSDKAKAAIKLHINNQEKTIIDNLTAEKAAKNS